jgi:serine protease Do
MLDLPRIVTGTTVGKQVEIILIRGGKEETHTDRVGRLDETPAPTQSINR